MGVLVYPLIKNGSVNRQNEITIKIAVAFFSAEIKKLVLNFVWKCKRLRIVVTILIKKNKVGGLTLLI